jgi:flagellar hook-length control protein FliK
VAERVQTVGGQGVAEFSIKLNPPELGSVIVHLRATEGSVTARVVVANDAARVAVEGQLGDLRDRLTQVGVTLGSFDFPQREGGSQQPSRQPYSQPGQEDDGDLPKSPFPDPTAAADRLDVVA